MVKLTVPSFYGIGKVKTTQKCKMVELNSLAGILCVVQSVLFWYMRCVFPNSLPVSLCSLSPIPSPASVGSTTSTGSGVGGASSLSSTQDPSPSSHVTVSKQVFNKAAEHLTITGYLHQSLELWQQSNLLVEQYRGVPRPPH